MLLFLDEGAKRSPQELIVMILDGDGWHKSSSLKIPETMRLVCLSPYSPELNPVEHLWNELREKTFCNLVFNSLDALEDHLAASLKATELDTSKAHSIAAWSWIINALLN
jgi:transposase